MFIVSGFFPAGDPITINTTEVNTIAKMSKFKKNQDIDEDFMNEEEIVNGEVLEILLPIF